MVGLARPAIGLAQGGLLYLLARALDDQVLPPLVFAAVLAVSYAVPLVVVAGLTALRPRTLALWIGLATAVCASVGAYDILRDPVTAAGAARFVPGVLMWLGLAAILFIVQAMVTAGDAERRLVATYPRYRDVAWTLAIRIALAILFAGLFWGLLWLGAALLDLVKVAFLRELIVRRWFAFPVTTTMFALAFHVTEIRANLVGSMRILLLGLLSWLLPVMAVLALIFLLALPFTGLEPLWQTRHATAILLTAVVVLNLLINAAFEDDGTENRGPLVLRAGRMAAALVMLPLVVLAGYGLMLRVAQYGFTPDRVLAAAGIVLASCYMAGYAYAAVREPLVMRPVATTNVATACVVVAVLLALLSPLADPARISVDDQVARLRAGRIDAEAFDYKFLRFDAGRHGVAALQRLAADPPGPDAALVAERSRAELKATRREQVATRPSPPVTPERRKANISVMYPAERALPESFLQNDWSFLPNRWELPRCLSADAKCKAALIDLDEEGGDEILLFNVGPGTSKAFKQVGNGDWTMLGTIINAHCQSARDAVSVGAFSVVKPALKEIEAGGQRLYIDQRGIANCNR
jgi:hypothetical protein